MRYAKAIVIVVLVVLGGLFLWGVSSRAAADSSLPAASGSPSPSTAPTASPTPVAQPASTAVVGWALKWRRQAIRSWREWNRARGCFGMRSASFHRHSARTPARSATGARWLDAGFSWKHDRGTYRARVAHLVYHMKHPGGTSSGARWLPLARWAGWPSSTWSMLTAVILRESSGRERAGEENGGIFRGLMQMWREHVADRFWNLLYTAEYNLREAYKLWLKEGWGPWAQTAY